jgi:hypothetical protein
MAAIKESGQTITFCGVNAHFQNAVVKRRIKTLHDQARTMLIHAQYWWRKAIDAHLWPYALRVANEVHNSTATLGREDLKSPFELFAKSEVNLNLNHFQPFGCPVFVLDSKMQAGQKLPKWEVRSRMGVYLGMSMQHSRSVALILNLKTGHVSPQFHVTFDPKFETVRQSLGKLSPPSEWQKICGFITSTASKGQGVKQAQQDQMMQSDLPFMEFDLEPGELVNEGGAQASQTPLLSLRENKIKNLKFNSGDLQGSTRSQKFQQPRPLMNLQVSQDPRSLMFGTTLKPYWKTSFLTMWPMKPSRNGGHCSRSASDACLC